MKIQDSYDMSEFVRRNNESENVKNQPPLCLHMYTIFYNLYKVVNNS